MFKKIFVAATILSFLICGCSTKEDQQESKKKQQQEEASKEFRKGSFRPSPEQKW